MPANTIKRLAKKLGTGVLARYYNPRGMFWVHVPNLKQLDFAAVDRVAHQRHGNHLIRQFSLLID
jgi:hypothetical protein